MSNDISTSKLTGKQEAFSQACLDPDNSASDAYRLAYNACNMSPEAVHVEASRLMGHPKVALRIRELRDQVTVGVVEARVWDRIRLVDEAEVNLYMAREARQFGPANKAVEIIARLTGNLEAPATDTNIQITKVTVVLPSGKGLHDGDTRLSGGVVDAERYELIDPEAHTP